MADQIEWICDDIVPDCKFPGDVMVSILTYLPVKSLLKFKAVSKPRCSLISSPRFLKLHLHRQSIVPPSNCLMVFKDYSVEQHPCRFGLLNLSQHSNPVTPFDGDVSILEFPPTDFTIIDSCNGLVCLGTYLLASTDLILCNPATRTHRTLDVPEGDHLDFSTLGLCYVDATNDFKILAWNHSDIKAPETPVDTPYLYVYSLSSDSWDRFDFFSPETDIAFERPCFMGRCMHWLAHTCPAGIFCTCSSPGEIVVFDVMDGALSWFHLPVACGRHGHVGQETLVIRGCLSIVNSTDTAGRHLDGFEVWVMEEYGVEGSWVKHYFIEEEFTLVSLSSTSWTYGEIVVYSVGDYDSKVLMIYDTHSRRKSIFEFSSYRVLALFDYVESLAYVGTS